MKMYVSFTYTFFLKITRLLEILFCWWNLHWPHPVNNAGIFPYTYSLFFFSLFTSQITGLQKCNSSHLPTDMDFLENKKEKGHCSKMLLPTYALLEPEWRIPLWNCSFILTRILRVWKEGRIFIRCYLVFGTIKLYYMKKMKNTFPDVTSSYQKTSADLELFS